MADVSPALLLSVVVIGRNEGERLSRCLDSVQAIQLPEGRWELIYVDSRSTDDSAARAALFTSKVIVLQTPPFSAALARNTGWQAAKGEFILFLDGDTVLHPGFVEEVLPYFADASLAAVCGLRKESRPQDSWYNAVLDIDWQFTPGPLQYCGGDALFRRAALAQVGGFRDSLKQGEEPELCRRLRQNGWSILGIDGLMTWHDLNIKSFWQYWQRCFRTGYAYAEVSDIYKNTDDPLWWKESQHNLLKGALLLLLLALALGLAFVWRSLFPAVTLVLLLLLLSLHTAYRMRKKIPNWRLALLYGWHAHLQHVPMFFGQLAYACDRWRGKKTRIIDYKRN